MNSSELDKLFYELLETWYSTELSLAQEFETLTTNFSEEAEEDHAAYKVRYEKIKKELITIGLEQY